MEIYNKDHPAYAHVIRNAIPSLFTLCRVASDDSKEISTVPLPAKRMRANIQHLPHLSAEVILNIIPYLDAPSTVCFALTSHSNYSLTLAHHLVERLSQLCPKDVREHFPQNLQDKVCNVLLPEPQNCDLQRGWRIKNFHGIPSARLNVDMVSAPMVLLGIQRLAYIRRVEWLGIDPEQSISTNRGTVRVPHGRFPFSNSNGFHVVNLSAYSIPVPVEECEAYMTWYVTDCAQENGHIFNLRQCLSSFGELLGPWLQRLRHQGFKVDADTRRRRVRERYGFRDQDAALKGRNAAKISGAISPAASGE